MMDQSVETSKDLANSIYESSQNIGRKITLIDSTDLSHFKSQEKTIEHDGLCICSWIWFWCMVLGSNFSKFEHFF